VSAVRDSFRELQRLAGVRPAADPSSEQTGEEKPVDAGNGDARGGVAAASTPHLVPRTH
jgi:hypothetical protein